MTLKNFKAYDVGTSLEMDPVLQNILKNLGHENLHSETLARWQQKLPYWNALANEAARPEKLPRLEKFDRVGQPSERVILPLETQTIRREVVEAGIWQNDSEVEKFAKVYLLAQLGESGVTCPLACTDGLIRVLEALGPDEIKKNYLPKLLSAQTPLAGAQFITEQSGGSDVGAIEGRAEPQPDGSWAIFAEKWYCSVADEYFLVLARPEGAPAGTKGLAIFFVPRTLECDNQVLVNKLSFKRLKNKLGTQSLPTAEIDFMGSRGFLVGKKEEGFYHLMHYILNISRLHNAANCLGILRRACVEAKNYAAQRVAFAGPIINYPLIQESLSALESRWASQLKLFFSLLNLIDQNGLVPRDREQNYWQRFLINLLKYRTAVTLTQDVKEAILIFGANGIVEDFSILPRLFRDAIILETWEGTHNVLCLQILRDCLKFDFWPRFEAEISGIRKFCRDTGSKESRQQFETVFTQLKESVTCGDLAHEDFVARHARRLVDQIGFLLEYGTKTSSL